MRHQTRSTKGALLCKDGEDIGRRLLRRTNSQEDQDPDKQPNMKDKQNRSTACKHHLCLEAVDHPDQQRHSKHKLCPLPPLRPILRPIDPNKRLYNRARQKASRSTLPPTQTGYISMRTPFRSSSSKPCRSRLPIACGVALRIRWLRELENGAACSCHCGFWRKRTQATF